MEVGFGRGVGRKGNGMMQERMKTEEKMRWNTMMLECESRPCNESFARVSAAAFLAPAGKRENSDEMCAGSGGESVSGDGKGYRCRY